MNSVWLLMGLCVLSYAGSFLVGKSAVRGGLPASTEYVLLGFVLGPSALGLVERSVLVAFEPAAYAAVGWLAFVLGLQYGVNGGRRVRVTRILGSWAAFLFTCAAIGGAVYAVLLRASALDARDRFLVAGGIAISTAETTRYAVRWIVERDHAAGPVTSLIGDLAEADDLIPLLAIGALFAWSPEHDLALAQGPRWIWFALTLGLGSLLGGMAAVLLGRTFRITEAWSVMLGLSMLTIGTSSRLGLAGLASMFVMGSAISILSRHRDDVVAMIAPTERPVMLPALLLAGATVDFTTSKWLWWVLPVAIVARLAAKTLVGFGVFAVVPNARKAGAQLGLGLSSSGALSMCLGLAFALRFPGAIGGSVLAAAFVAIIVGELVGPPVLRASLRRAGEVPDATDDPPAGAEVPPDAPVPEPEGGPAAADAEAAS